MGAQASFVHLVHTHNFWLGHGWGGGGRDWELGRGSTCQRFLSPSPVDFYIPDVVRRLFR